MTTRLKLRGLLDAPCGMGNFTCCVIGGSKLRGPVGYMGGKHGLAPTILATVGLSPGCGAESVVMVDKGPPGVVWLALAQPETARAVADLLRSWRHEDPVALWRRLASEPPPEDLVGHAASVLWLQGRTPGCTPLWYDGERWCVAEAPGHGAATFGARQKGTSNGKDAGLRSSVTVARRIDAIAAYLVMQAHAPSGIPVWPSTEGWRQDGRNFGPDGQAYGARTRTACRGNKPASVGSIASAASAASAAIVASPALTVVHGDVAEALALLPEDLEGWLCYFDPDYVGCTAYSCTWPRSEVVAASREVSRRGAITIVSEAVPVAELDGPGWEAVDITGAKARRSTKIKREWLTLNRPPQYRVATQTSMF